MIIIKYSTKYQKERRKFLKNNLTLAEKTIKTITVFITNPHHPSLNLEKLKGTNIWTMRINKSDRIFFAWKSKTSAIFIDIGRHDKYRKY